MSSAIVDLAIELLRVDASGEQRLVWAPRAEDGIAKIIDTLFEFPTETRAGIDDLIRLVCALELELRSPQTAARLRTMLQSDPRVVSLCDLRRSEELRLQQTRWSGSDETKQAPSFGKKRPGGTITAAFHQQSLLRRMKP